MVPMMLKLGERFEGFGLAGALLRNGENDSDDLTFLFWFKIATSIVCSLIIVFTPSIAAVFFHRSAVREVILASLVGVALSGSLSASRPPRLQLAIRPFFAVRFFGGWIGTA